MYLLVALRLGGVVLRFNQLGLRLPEAFSLLLSGELSELTAYPVDRAVVVALFAVAGARSVFVTLGR